MVSSHEAGAPFSLARRECCGAYSRHAQAGRLRIPPGVRLLPVRDPEPEPTPEPVVPMAVRPD
eukprot:7749421-Alexandrium_andersonii.AAC.1